MNGIIIINKPAGMTSHDVVNQIRKIFKTKKVGHCGTLDPDATGVLVVAINKATKILQFLTADSKEYIATLSLGTATDTYDASGKIIEQKEFQPISKEIILKTLSSFTGIQEQIPPMHSAIKVKGKKLYEYARNHETVEIPKRTIEIKDIELLSVDNNLIQFKVACSKGTYIRSLCYDIAKKLNYPGHMAALIRSKSGIFSIEDAYTLKQIENGEFELLTIEQALSNYPKLVVDDENIVFHGKKIKSDIDHQVAIYNQNNQILAIYGPDGNGYLKNIRGLW
ncbi:tRNA pseudouridine(55) synthase TruB [Thomasclavelia sp.]|uniref:tRNA pseudouridine(55) synthase TruB n=1 Tax=Thomasclavelia sp. TaxID=3025757 RepID=UPI0025D634F1|nr:tRNA pseudouridine(55) synthase TruB [Thomasclavelia sp.]